MVDRTKPDASPKSTDSEKERINDYDSFVGWLHKNEDRPKWDTLIQKFTKLYSQDKSKLRYPWFEGLKQDERLAWTKEFVRIAVKLRMPLEFIVEDIYDTAKDGLPWVVRLYHDEEKKYHQERDEARYLAGLDNTIRK